jgi:chromosome partitioning protein
MTRRGIAGPASNSLLIAPLQPTAGGFDAERGKAGESMRTIAFVTQKGGAGKSTLASSVAVAAHKAGERVFICDLDPLQSLVKWSKARKSVDIPVNYIPPAKLVRALGQLEAEGVTLAILDTPGADSDHSEQAIRAADLCIVPARPNVLDIWASEATIARVKANRKDFAFLLNQCPPTQQSGRVARGAAALQELGALIEPLISTRVDYQEAVRLGLGVGEFNPRGVAAREMTQLWGSLSRRLSTAAAEAAAEPRPVAARTPYQDIFDEALKVGNIYTDFVNSLLRFNEAPVSGNPPPPAQPADMRSKRGGRGAA